MRQLKHPATIVAAIALFVALGGGMALAAHGLISGSKNKNHSIPEKKLTNSAISALTGASAAHAYSAFSVGGVAIGATLTTVDTLTLGAGSYVVMANTTAYNSSAEDDVGCFLYAPDSTQLDAAYVSFHLGTAITGQNQASLLAPLTTTGGNVTLKCIGGDANTTIAYSRIMAMTVGSVTGTAVHVHGAPKARVSTSR